ncbi:MAG: hypothetical protein O9264_15585 [Leptospira sp.]|jgi:hypothetical protein|nr:hypothetical protein [Leptospira sp.]
MKNVLILIFGILFTQNCLISYRDFPKILPIPAQEKNKDAILVYNLPNFPQFNLGGREALKSYFDTKTPFKNTQEGVDVPKVGYLINVKVDYRSPSKPALVFLALSTITATFLPAWSEQDGYDVQYHLYKDGKVVKVYEYHIFRNYSQWLPLILGIWYNGETATEKEVFERVTNQFFNDAKEFF